MEIAQKLFEAVDESKLKTLEEMKLIVAKYDFRQKGGEDSPTVSSGVMNVVADLTDSGKEMTENEFSEVTNYLKQFQIKKREGTKETATEKEKEKEMDRKVREIIEWFEKRPKEEAKAAPDSAEIDAVKNKMASEPESEERRLDREKRMIDEAKEKFRPKVKYPNGLGNQNEMVDKVFDLLSAATTAASTPPEVIQAISGVFQLESELASFLSAVAAGTIANDDVRKMVASSLKSYITAYLAEYVLKKNSDMMIEVAQNDTPENVAAILEKVLKAVAMPSAPKLSPVKGVVPTAAPTAHAEPPKQGILSSITSAVTGMKKEAEAAPHDAQPQPVTATAPAATAPAATAPAATAPATKEIATAPAAKETATVPTETATVPTAKEIATAPTETATAPAAKEAATAPTETASVPTKTVTAPAAKEIETALTETVTAPAAIATTPAETATVPTETATVPTEAATEPAETATVPTAKEIATAPAAKETATVPTAKEIATAPAAKETATVPTEIASAPASYAATKPAEGVNATQNKLQTDFEKTKKIQTDTLSEVEKRTKAVQEALNAPKSYEQLVLAEHLAKEELETSVANYEQNKDKDISLKQKYLEAKLKAESNYDVIKAKLEKAKNDQIKGGKKRKKSKSKTYYASAWTNKRNFRKRKHGQTRKGRRRFLV